MSNRFPDPHGIDRTVEPIDELIASMAKERTMSTYDLPCTLYNCVDPACRFHHIEDDEPQHLDGCTECSCDFGCPLASEPMRFSPTELAAAENQRKLKPASPFTEPVKVRTK